MAEQVQLLSAADRAYIRRSEHECDCAVCDDLVERYEATLAALEAQTKILRSEFSREQARRSRAEWELAKSVKG